MDMPPRTYTAAELAAAVNRELRTDLTARTIYFYRTKGVLSPLEMVGSQPKFTERHRLELKAVLAMQRGLDRPNLEEVAERIRSLDGPQLATLAAESPPTTDEIISRSALLGRYGAPFGPDVRDWSMLATSPALLRRPGGAARRTVEITPGVALRLDGSLPDDFVRGLIECVTLYCSQHGEVRQR
jgi:DNA-binding transcriptional MerR regulator